MKTAYELLLDSPDNQVTRMQLVFKAVAAGEWKDAMHFLRNAAREESGTLWALEAAAFADACEKQINPYQLVAENKTARNYWFGK